MRSSTRDRAFLTTRESADRLGVSVNTLKAWIRQQRLPALRTPGGHHRIAEADLEAFRARLARAVRPRAVTRDRILVVDDDPQLLETIGDGLRRMFPDATVETVADGYDALLKIGAFRPDVLVLDLRMPRLEGYDVCARLKAGAATRAIRIVAMTAHADEEARQRALACGADAFLGKPFTLEGLEAAVRGLLRDPGEP
jgi:excisionase family DNA binding protein